MGTSNEVAVQGSRVITVNLPSQQKMEAKAAGVLATVEALDIDSDGMMEIAADELRGLKKDYSKLEEARKLHVGPLNDEVKFINNFFRTALTCMEQAEGALKRKMLTYQNQQEQKRREEQARIEAEQRAERARIAAENAAREKAAREEAERQRAEQQAAQERERAAQAEAARRQAEAQAAIQAGDEARAREATRLQIEAEAAAERQRQAAAQADADAAAAVESAAQQNAANDIVAAVMTAPVLSIAPKLSGVSTKGTYKGKCTSLLDLVRFIAKHPEHVNLVKANETAINQIAKAQREACQIDGILVWEDRVLAARRA